MRARWRKGISQVAVEPAGRVDGDRQRGDVAALAPAVAEEVAERHLDRRRRLVVPVTCAGRACRQAVGLTVIQICWMAPGPVDVGQRRRASPRQVDAGRDLPARPSSRAATAPVPSVAMPPAPFAPGEVLGADGAGLRLGEPRQVAQAHAEAVEVSRHRSLLRSPLICPGASTEVTRLEERLSSSFGSA